MKPNKPPLLIMQKIQQRLYFMKVVSINSFQISCVLGIWACLSILLVSSCFASDLNNTAWTKNASSGKPTAIDLCFHWNSATKCYEVSTLPFESNDKLSFVAAKPLEIHDKIKLLKEIDLTEPSDNIRKKCIKRFNTFVQSQSKIRKIKFDKRDYWFDVSDLFPGITTENNAVIHINYKWKKSQTIHFCRVSKPPQATHHFIWTYPMNWAVLPVEFSKDGRVIYSPKKCDKTIKDVVDTIKYLLRHKSTTVNVFILGYADKKTEIIDPNEIKSPPKDEIPDVNFYLSWARMLGWKVVLHREFSEHIDWKHEGINKSKPTTNRLRIHGFCYGSDLDNSQLNKRWPIDADQTPYPKEVQKNISVSRRVDIFIATSENPSAVRAICETVNGSCTRYVHTRKWGNNFTPKHLSALQNVDMFKQHFQALRKAMEDQRPVPACCRPKKP